MKHMIMRRILFHVQSIHIVWKVNEVKMYSLVEKNSVHSSRGMAKTGGPGSQCVF